MGIGNVFIIFHESNISCSIKGSSQTICCKWIKSNNQLATSQTCVVGIGNVFIIFHESNISCSIKGSSQTICCKWIKSNESVRIFAECARIEQKQFSYFKRPYSTASGLDRGVTYLIYDSIMYIRCTINLCPIKLLSLKCDKCQDLG